MGASLAVNASAHCTCTHEVCANDLDADNCMPKPVMVKSLRSDTHSEPTDTHPERSHLEFEQNGHKVFDGQAFKKFVPQQLAQRAGSPKVSEEVVIECLPFTSLQNPHQFGPCEQRLNIFGKLLDFDVVCDDKPHDQFDFIKDDALNIIGSLLGEKTNSSVGAVGTPSPRALPFEATLSRGHDQLLGLVITPDVDSSYLYIEDIWESSVVSEWNDNNGPDKQIRVGNIITAVNGVASAAQDMLKTLRNLEINVAFLLRIEDIGSEARKKQERQRLRRSRAMEAMSLPTCDASHVAAVDTAPSSKHEPKKHVVEIKKL